MLCLATRSFPTLCDPMVCNLPGSSVLGASPGKNTGVGCLHGIFPTQGLNPGSPHCRQIVGWSTREAQESWSGQPNSSLEDIPDQRIELGSPALQEGSLPAELPGKPTIYNGHYILAWQLFRNLLFNSQIVMLF